jgi:hypothetical protein
MQSHIIGNSPLVLATTIDGIKTMGYSLMLFFGRGETNVGI